MELDVCKVIALVLLTICSFISAFVPLKIRKISKFFRSKSDRKDSILTVIQCFGGGLLLGTSWILMLPEIRDELSAFNDATIPIAELLLSAGFFIIYLIEELSSFVMPEFCKNLSKFQIFAEDQEDENENFDPLQSSQPRSTSTPKKNDSENQLQPDGIDTVDDTNSSRFNEISLDAITSSPEDTPAQNSFTSFNPKYAGSLNTSTQSMFPNYRPNVEASKVQRLTLKHNIQLPKLSIPKGIISKSDQTDTKAKSSKFAMKKHEIVTVGLLCLYYLSEGLIIGLSSSHVSLWQLFSVLLVHQILSSTSIGIAMSIGKSSIGSIVLLSISSCIGVAVGIGIFAISEDSNMAAPILKGLASGAMFYNVILEVIHQEKLRKNVSGLLQFGSILFGFIITVLIKILSANDEYSEYLEESQSANSTALPPPIIG